MMLRLFAQSQVWEAACDASQRNRSMFNAPEKTFHGQMKTLLNAINYDLEHIAAPCVLSVRLGIRVLSNI